MSSYEKSDELLKRAVKVTPLGAQTYSKSYRYYCQGDSPSFIDRGEGCYLYDVDGNKFIDFVCAFVNYHSCWVFSFYKSNTKFLIYKTNVIFFS